MNDEISRLEEYILLSLSSNDSLYGLEIQGHISAAFDKDVSFGSLYPALHRLKKRGLLKAEWGDSYKGSRRKYYAIAAEGHTALEKLETRRRKLRLVFSFNKLGLSF